MWSGSLGPQVRFVCLPDLIGIEHKEELNTKRGNGGKKMRTTRGVYLKYQWTIAKQS